MTTKPSNTSRILQAVADAAPERRLTLREIAEAALPKEFRRDSTYTISYVAAVVSQQVAKGKLDRQGVLRAYTYGPTATTLVDGRFKAEPTSPPQPKRKPGRPARFIHTSGDPEAIPDNGRRYKIVQTPKQQAKPAKTTKAKPTSGPRSAPVARVIRREELRVTRPAAPPPVVVVPNPALAKPQRAALDSEQIAADIAAFQARGGAIERLPNGACSKPLRSVITEASHVALNERTWRERQLRETAQQSTRAKRARNDDSFDDAATDVA